MANPRMANFLAKVARTELGLYAIGRTEWRIASMAEDQGYGDVISMTTFAISDQGRAAATPTT